MTAPQTTAPTTAPLPPSLTQPPIGDGSFPAGTPIAVASPDGAPTELPVESLARGDKVLTLGGPVAVRHVTLTRLDQPQAGPDQPLRARVVPVRVAAGAFGEGQPVADLLLPPEALVHMLDSTLPQGALVPLGALVNGTTIRREPPGIATTWVRLELEKPGVVIASGLLVAARIDPAAAPPAPFLPAGPATLGLRQRLARPAAPAPEPHPEPESELEPPAPTVAAPAVAASAAAAPEPPATPAPESPPAGSAAPMLRAVVDGAVATLLDGSTELQWSFLLPGGAALVRLISPRGLPATTPAEQRAAARRYGVAIRAILVEEQTLPLDGPAIGDGFHALESAGSESWRWTAGEATLHLPPAPAARRLTVQITDWHRLLQPE